MKSRNLSRALIESGRIRKSGIAFAAMASGFVISLGLSALTHTHQIGPLLLSISYVCWKAGWRAGVAASALGILVATLELRPLFSFKVDSTPDLVRLTLFSLIAAVLCAISFASDHRAKQLSSTQKRLHDSSHWLEAARQLTQFSTWEIDSDRNLVQWTESSGVLPSRKSTMLNLWLSQFHPEDQAHLFGAIEESRQSKTLLAQLRIRTREGYEPVLLRGIVPESGVSGESRLIGVSVQMKSDTNPVEFFKASRSELVGIDDLLNNLRENPTLDIHGRLSVEMAREAVERLRRQQQQLIAS
jgi:hypothetical protein